MFLETFPMTQFSTELFQIFLLVTTLSFFQGHRSGIPRRAARDLGGGRLQRHLAVDRARPGEQEGQSPGPSYLRPPPATHSPFLVRQGRGGRTDTVIAQMPV